MNYIVLQITFLKIGMKDEPYSNIQSFRRQVYINIDTVKNFPTAVAIKYFDKEYRIFFNDKSKRVRCFLCKEHHDLISAVCSTNIEMDENNDENENKNNDTNPRFNQPILPNQDLT